MAAVDIVKFAFLCIEFGDQQCNVAFAIIGHGVDSSVQPSHHLQNVSIVICLKLHGCRRCGHQEGGGNAFSGYIGNDELNGVRVDGDIVVVVAANAPRWPHHAGDFKSGNGRFALWKKQALDLRGQLHIVKELVTLLLNRFGECFTLFDIALDDVNNKGEAERRRKIVEDPEPWVQIPRRVIVMEQDANRDEAITNFPAQENRSDGKREKVEVNK